MIFTKEQLTRIIESADEVITALAGTNDDIHPDNSTKMCAAWDDLNDRNAPPSVVKRLAELALAGMEAEPAYFINRVKRSDAYGDDVELRTYCYELDALKSKDDFGGEVVSVYSAPQPITTSERAELENYRNAQQVGGPCGVRAKVNDGHHVGAGDGSYGRAGDDLSARGMGGSGCGNNALQQNSKCSCRTCRPVTMNDMRFVVCPDCGNKRCPRANDCSNACTGSNEPGQDGSAYPAAPKEVL